MLLFRETVVKFLYEWVWIFLVWVIGLFIYFSCLDHLRWTCWIFFKPLNVCNELFEKYKNTTCIVCWIAVEFIQHVKNQKMGSTTICIAFLMVVDINWFFIFTLLILNHLFYSKLINLFYYIISKFIIFMIYK